MKYDTTPTADPAQLLEMARELVAERGVQYGTIADNFALIADLATLRLGRNFHAYEIAVVMSCVKHARNFSDPTHVDSRVDGCNYELFAQQFAADYVRAKQESKEVLQYKTRKELQPAEVTSIRDLATKYAPKKENKIPSPVSDAIQSAIGRLEE